MNLIVFLTNLFKADCLNTATSQNISIRDYLLLPLLLCQALETHCQPIQKQSASNN